MHIYLQVLCKGHCVGGIVLGSSVRVPMKLCFRVIYESENKIQAE
jgi:hypothetical protein